MTERNTRIRASQIRNVLPDDLEATNSPSNKLVPSYDLSTTKFTWVTNQGLFEIDIDGNLIPSVDANTDEYYELDVNDDIQPKTA